MCGRGKGNGALRFSLLFVEASLIIATINFAVIYNGNFSVRATKIDQGCSYWE